MFLGLVFSLTVIVLFAWAMLRLAVYALPVALGFMTFLWAAEGEPGLAVGILLGLVVGVAVFLAGRLLIASRLPVLLRAGVAVLFALPAGIAGHSVVSALMRLGGAGPTSAAIVAVIGGIVIAGVALASLVQPIASDDQRAIGGRPIAR